jgi:S-DNA-T family DNA segregation ATPase FtsK/SpoIIIE
VQDVAGYRNAGGTEPLPRSLLVIDEFQEFFVQDDSIAQEAALLFDRIIRQGRAFGIHVLLGTQTLGGAYSLPRATLGQIVIRIALQCNEADAYLIMDDSNPAPRLLSRPGEGIYNDAAGAVEGNSPFQVVWLGDAERDQWLDKVRDLAGKRGIRNRPVVFEGNAPADVHENQAFLSLMQNPPAHAPGSSRIWLGAPNAIKGHTEVLFQRQSGNNLLIIGQRDETALSMMVYGIAALSAQHPAGSAQFILFHASAEGSPDARLVEELLQAVPSVKACTRPAEITQTLAKIADTVEARTGDSSPVFLFIHGLQRFRKLKHEDDFGFGGDAEDQSDGARLNTLIREGSAAGIHLILSVDTLNNVNRFLNRRALSEFEMRVLFQMSANDSSTLIDSPKASELGLHRALLCNEQTGTLETFRPYAPPPPRWLAEFGKRIQSAI